MQPEKMAQTVSQDLAREIRDRCGEDVNNCFQCRKCGAGCPMAFAMDHSPSRLMHAARLGLDDLVLSSRTIWLCSSCLTCSTRCPQGLDVARVMDAAKIIAVRRGRRPPEPGVAAFNKSMLRSCLRHGRVFELGMIAGLKLRTGEPFKDMGLGMQMLRKGKLKLWPSRARGGKLGKIARRVRAMEEGTP
jgi:heterodisulfide reductase subunit C